MIEDIAERQHCGRAGWCPCGGRRAGLIAEQQRVGPGGGGRSDD